MTALSLDVIFNILNCTDILDDVIISVFFKVSALLVEPMFVVSGVHMPPSTLYKSLFK